ncbi:hypothetical protein PGT21_000143 [Puccinia graminis f. sp. tritici]|uniref:Uncharacterized protein n=1 Tax=Puccinia graminis f. sp. tritici TaxID=56615 RepID=A0A5B0MHT0_PUCGR|nr:hypothetical protein PGT21_024389 [Puccinia graminis f. sp. tritici]KAA1075709.1 hypothetical protein PGT21_000143 [Puccinia graminis f. sp. tritici]
MRSRWRVRVRVGWTGNGQDSLEVMESQDEAMVGETHAGLSFVEEELKRKCSSLIPHPSLAPACCQACLESPGTSIRRESSGDQSFFRVPDLLHFEIDWHAPFD